MIIDDVKISIEAGHGGRGMSTFSKIKFAFLYGLCLYYQRRCTVNSGVKCNSVVNFSQYTTNSRHFISTPVLE